MKERIGFIGLRSMARHGRQSAAQAASPRALAAASDIVILCVTGSREVEALVKGPDGLAAAKTPLLIIDCSTSNPSSTTALAADLATQGVT